jgi:hypothetical protein
MDILNNKGGKWGAAIPAVGNLPVINNKIAKNRNNSDLTLKSLGMKLKNPRDRLIKTSANSMS